MWLTFNSFTSINEIIFYGHSFWKQFGGGKAFSITYADFLYFEVPHIKPYLKEFLNKMIQYKRNKLMQNGMLKADTLKIENELPLWVDD
jgi:hypothetical protein